MKLSVVIPAHNEEGSIQETIFELHSTLVLENIEHEVVVVNDNSNDSIEDILKHYTDPNSIFDLLQQLTAKRFWICRSLWIAAFYRRLCCCHDG